MSPLVLDLTEVSGKINKFAVLYTKKKRKIKVSGLFEVVHI